MISAVSQNRFAAPQRIQCNNQAQTFGKNEIDYHELEAQNIGTGGLIGIAAVIGFMAIGIPLLSHLCESNGRDAREQQLIPIIDSLSHGQINAKNIDQYLEKKELAKQADSLNKTIGKIKL